MRRALIVLALALLPSAALAQRGSKIIKLGEVLYPIELRCTLPVVQEPVEGGERLPGVSLQYLDRRGLHVFSVGDAGGWLEAFDHTLFSFRLVFLQSNGRVETIVGRKNFFSDVPELPDEWSRNLHGQDRLRLVRLSDGKAALLGLKRPLIFERCPNIRTFGN